MGALSNSNHSEQHLKAFDTCIQAFDKSHDCGSGRWAIQTNPTLSCSDVIMLAAGSWRLVFNYEGGKQITEMGLGVGGT